MINSIIHDGKLNGFNYELYESLRGILKIPLIAEGGASSLEDFVKISSYPEVSAVAGKHLSLYENYPNMVKGALSKAGIPVRICSDTDYSFNY